MLENWKGRRLENTYIVFLLVRFGFVALQNNKWNPENMTWTPENTRQKGFTVFHMVRKIKNFKLDKSTTFVHILHTILG